MKTLLILLFLTCCLQVGALSAQSIERIEPPFWWAGMNEHSLQLMVYGNELAGSEVSSSSSDIKVIGAHSLDNPNYLFVDLDVGAVDSQLTFTLNFSKGDTSVAASYELKARNMGENKQAGFSSKDVIYLVTPDRFVNGDTSNDSLSHLSEIANRDNKDGRHGGDLQGLEHSLTYLRNLGITKIWLNPLQENNEPAYSYHGYSISDLYRIDDRLGGNKALLSLVEKANGMGIGLIMDTIPNHIGVNHWWMDDLPSKSWINNDTKFTPTSHRRETIQDPHASDADKVEFNDAWFVPTMPDLNQHVPELATYLIQNNIWWVEYASLSGLRVDTLPYADKHFTKQFNRRLLAEFPSLNIVGEEWSTNPAIVSYWQSGKRNQDGFDGGVPSLMDFPLQEALVNSLLNEEGWSSGLIELYETIANDFQYPDSNSLVVIGDNHDMSRIFTQLGENQALLEIALTVLMTTRGIPQLFYGTEIAMSNKGSDAHGLIRSDFPGGWSGDVKNVFTKTGLSALEISTLRFTRSLLNWRKTSEPVHNGKLKHFSPKKGVYVYFRYTENKAVMVVVNKNEEALSLDLSRFAEVTANYSVAKDAFSQAEQRLSGDLTVPGKKASIYELH